MYKIEYDICLEKVVKNFSKADQTKIRKAIEEIARNPRSQKTIKMKGTGKIDLYRVDLWPYRIIYTIEDKKMLVTVLKIGQREGVYK